MWTSLIISNQKDPGKEAVVTSVLDPDPHHSVNLDPHPHQIKIRIRNKIFKLYPYQFADVNPKCMEYEPILALFQGFDPFLKLGSES